jgi:hypothetical protein
MTARQELVLSEIIRFLETNNTTPTMRHLVGVLPITTPGGVRCHIRALRHQGHLVQLAGGRIALSKKYKVLVLPNPA